MLWEFLRYIRVRTRSKSFTPQLEPRFQRFDFPWRLIIACSFKHFKIIQETSRFGNWIWQLHTWERKVPCIQNHTVISLKYIVSVLVARSQYLMNIYELNSRNDPVQNIRFLIYVQLKMKVKTCWNAPSITLK